MTTLDTLLKLLPPARLEQLAVTYELDGTHRVRLTGPAVFLCLLNGLLHHPQLSLRLLQHIYQQQTGQSADHSSFGKSLNTLSPAYFEALAADLYAKMQPQTTLAQRQALRLRWIDATVVSLSAKLTAFGLRTGTRRGKGTQRQVKTVFELQEDQLPRLLRLCRRQAELSDAVALGESMQKETRAGDLWVFDSGCDARQRLFELHQAGAFWLSPHKRQGLQNKQTIFTAQPALLPSAAPAGKEPTCVVVCVEQATFGNSQESADQQGQWAKMPLLVVHLRRFDQRTTKWKPLVLMTNLPLSADRQHAGPYTFAEVAQVYRQRWDLEVCFKFFKQHLGFSHLLNRSENGIQIMLYMSLIVALLLIWYQRQTALRDGWRIVKFWLAEQVRAWTQQLLQGISLQPDG